MEKPYEVSQETQDWLQSLSERQAEISVIDLNKTSPYFNSILRNPLIPGIVSGDEEHRIAHSSPVLKIGALPSHRLIGTSVLGLQFDESKAGTIESEEEVTALCDIGAASEKVEADPALKAEYFDKGIGYSLKVADKTASFANAAIPLLATTGIGQALNVNSLSPGLSFASSVISAGNVWQAFADDDATVWKKTASVGALLSSIGALALDLTGQYKDVSTALKFTSSGLALVDAVSNKGALIGAAPG